MHTLGKIGFDWKLLIIQIINFLVLYYLVKIFFFKPIIQSIKKDIAEKKRVEEEKKLIEKKVAEWSKEKEKLLKEAESKANKIIHEADEFSKEMKLKVGKELAKYREEYLERIKNQSR
ncbi:hypothetical protein J7K86_02155, partial [bacterium]|nr:hypothetical protein [bacterium]